MSRSSSVALGQLGVWAALVVSVVPGLWAFFMADTVDSTPRWLCVGLGFGLAALIALVRQRRRTRREARELAERFGERRDEGSSNKKARRKEQTHLPPLPTRPPPEAEAGATARTILLVLGPPCWLCALLLGGNRLLDRSPPVRHQVTLYEVKDPQKGPDTIIVSSWRTPGAYERFTKNSFTMAGVHTGTPRGTPLLLELRAGALGWPYIASLVPAR